MNKKIGYIGLGKMGFNMVERLLGLGYFFTVYDKNPDTVAKAVGIGAEGSESVTALVKSMESPRLIWIMSPHQTVDEILTEMLPYLKQGDTVIDGGNSPYRESVRRGKELEEKGIRFLDVGVSGGPGGARDGACLMIGGKREVYQEYENLFADISAKDAYAHMGKCGAGHFTKMIHNGIEYGMMQAIAEGFDILKKSDFDLSMKDVAILYNHRSVVESRLIGWAGNAFEQYGDNLEKISGEVGATGEGLWSVEEAKRLNIPVPVIGASVEFRNKSKNNPSYQGKILSALRNQFGGHKAI